MSEEKNASMPKSQLLLALVIAVAIAGGSFFAGMKYAQSSAPANRFANGGDGARGNFPGGQQGGRNMVFRGAGGARGEGVTSGSVSKLDSGMLTLKTMDGGSKLVVMSSSTKVMQMTEAGLDVLKTDTPVMVMGTPNADGSITAVTVQIRPARPTDAPVPTEQKKP